MLFKHCFASEKVHGTSAHVAYSRVEDKLSFFSGGAKQVSFIACFDQEALLAKFRENSVRHPEIDKIVVFGEAYGGSMQGMKDTYGPDLRFIAFEVQIHEDWLSVEEAHGLVTFLGLEFVPYERIVTTEEAINAAMMTPSQVAVRRGMGADKMREGVVLRPIVELVHPNGGRIIVKHKRPEFSERATTPKIATPEKLKVLEVAAAIADEWVTGERLKHVLDALQLPAPQPSDTRAVLNAMVEDIYREAKGEIVESQEARKAICKATVKLLRRF